MGYRLHHLQLGIPPGSEAAARAFYVGVLGLVELPKPATLAPRGGLWLALQGTELHLGIESEFRPATKAHPAFEVDDLEETRARLDREGLRTVDDTLLPRRRRFYTTDPFGNRLEFVAREGV